MAKGLATAVPDNDGDEYYVVPVIQVDWLIHTNEQPECSEPDCFCHAARRDELAQNYQDGLVTAEDATRILSGRTV